MKPLDVRNETAISRFLLPFCGVGGQTFMGLKLLQVGKKSPGESVKHDDVISLTNCASCRMPATCWHSQGLLQRANVRHTMRT